MWFSILVGALVTFTLGLTTLAVEEYLFSGFATITLPVGGLLTVSGGLLTVVAGIAVIVTVPE